MFFSEEKNQKTFDPHRRRQHPGPGRHRKTGREVKVFCFFFSKKKALLPSYRQAQTYGRQDTENRRP
jgi:hypothetical protein